MLLLQINNNIRHPDDVSWNHVSMCILNGGAIRSPIDERNNGMLPGLGSLTQHVLSLAGPMGSRGSSLPPALHHSVGLFNSGPLLLNQGRPRRTHRSSS